MRAEPARNWWLDRFNDQSPRAGKAFVAINCGAIPEHLLEDELFGHVKGAYTDARKPRIGKFELAQGGTLFLDEIGNMPLVLQIKLLRVIELRELQRLGSNDIINTDVRIVAATNSNLKEKVRQGEFREDLLLSPQCRAPSSAAIAHAKRGCCALGEPFSRTLRH